MSINNPIRVLIADDETSLRGIIAEGLAYEGLSVSEAEDGKKALAMLGKEDFDVLVLDIDMPGINGIDVLRIIREKDFPVEVIMLTGVGSIATTVDAMRLGAHDYLTKPIRIAELKLVIEKAVEKKQLLLENLALKTRIRQMDEKSTIITRNHLMLDLMEQARKSALSDYPILILGESGSGKEVLARYIHEYSTRAGKPFMPINCGAIPEQVIESELFGYEKGAFTGAVSRKPGMFEIANNGSVFLDEIGDMPLTFQVKLLRAIETKTFMPLGSIKERHVDLRIISATNKMLAEEIVRKNFRQDLYYRINAITLTIPPLRDRKEDILLLIDHFKASNRAFIHKKFSDKALAVLSDYHWPGNVRELQNVVQKMLLFSGNDIIDCSEVPSEILSSCGTSSRKLDDIEKGHILRTLNEVGGHRGKAAEALGIDPKTLYRKMKAFSIKG